MLLFGLGSVAGMAVATGIAGAALSRVARGGKAQRVLTVSTGFVSCICGVAWALPLIA